MSLYLKLFRLGFIGFIAMSVVAIAIAATGYLVFASELPPVESLKDVRLQTPLKIYSREGELIGEFGEQRRIPLTYEEIPQQMLEAFLAAEDDRFFDHPGVDYQGLIRAGINLLLTGEKAQGGSTITMQLARNFFLSPERKYTRKIKEILLALRIEKTLTKNEILALYLNKIYLGKGAYGVGAAAQIYYNKDVTELNLAEIAMIAGLPKAPSNFNPINNPERALIRRDYVLGRMYELDMIDETQYQLGLEHPIEAKSYRVQVELEAPFVSEMVRAKMVEQYGEDAYTLGFKVFTTIESDKQRAAVGAVEKGVLDYDRRHGFRGAEGRIPLDQVTQAEAVAELVASMASVSDLQPGIVTQVEDELATIVLADVEIQLTLEDVVWARTYKSVNSMGPKPKTMQDVLNLGDIVRVIETEDGWQLSQIPTVSSALVSLRSEDGAVLALTGGFDFYTSKFNRVTQAMRQPGSAFKPFIYSAALDAGFTPASIVNDAPVVFEDKSTQDTWRPHNYSGKFFGPTRLRAALTKSRNLVSIRLLRDIGRSFALEHVDKFGFDAEKLPTDLTLALGSGAMTPLKLASGYAIFANGGYKVEPYFIERIEDSNGEILFSENPARVCDEECARLAAEISLHAEEFAELGFPDPASDSDIGINSAPRVISEANIYQMDSMLKDVIRLGTGRKALVLERKDLAGKTGTTNEQRDAWFAGYQPEVVTVVWMGFDQHKPLGRRETGGVAALPIWINYMRGALADVPQVDRPLPEDMMVLKINPENGLLVDQESAFGLEEVFHIDNIPAVDRNFGIPDKFNPATPSRPQELPEQIF